MMIIESIQKLRAIDIHRERANRLRVPLLHRFMEMKLAIANAPDWDIIQLEADIETYRAVLMEDSELEQLATEKEREEDATQKGILEKIDQS